MAWVKAICISEIRGIQKHEIPLAYLRQGHGIEGDAHAGAWHRQVSLLGTGSVAGLQDKLDFRLENGAFAENILVEGMNVHEQPVGTLLRIGQALCRVTQIGKECHQDCAIRRAAGDCVMPREGVFAEVIESGEVKKGDSVETVPWDKAAEA